MSDYETFTTVGGHGEIHLVGVPFQPETPELDVVVSPQKASSATINANHRLATLLSALDHGHNTNPIGSLSAESYMTAKFFVDTNVLLYAASNALADQPKRAVARRALGRT